MLSYTFLLRENSVDSVNDKKEGKNYKFKLYLKKSLQQAK